MSFAAWELFIELRSPGKAEPDDGRGIRAEARPEACFSCNSNCYSSGRSEGSGSRPSRNESGPRARACSRPRHTADADDRVDLG